MIDGLKDGAVFVMSFLAFGIDLTFRTPRTAAVFLQDDEGQ